MLQGKTPYSNSGYKSVNLKIHLCISLCTSFPYGLHLAIFGLGNQEPLVNLPHTISEPSSVWVHTQHNWPDWTVIHKFQNSPVQ